MYFAAKNFKAIAPAARLLNLKGDSVFFRGFSSSRVSNTGNVVGFAGLGNMGRHMANNLLKKSDKSLVVYDINPEATTRFSTQKDFDMSRVSVAGSLGELAERSSIIITMLPESAHAKSAFMSPDGILSGMKKGTMCIDSSTIDTSVSAELSNAIIENGGIPLDAPVSGGVMGAEAATLTFMVGSRNEEEFLKAKEILQLMGKNVIHCGGLGNGQTVKICNNMLLGCTMIAAAEAMNLGVKLGVDPKLLASVINTSSGRSWSSEISNPHPNVSPNAPSNRNYDGGFGTKLMLKDMELSLNAAKSTNSPVFLSGLSAQIYRHTCNKDDLANKDFSSVYKWLTNK
ncbi:hypothetical protein BB558_000800 [Smittium angustum]|uniref:3-hydroxyisobutyrate dehydrogenase n=1 Tax=Smittium angustum TaxID=133377 RepID=A0A2U1JDK0_SMIAN|nr:hypothetical protein BB558_000800 [Smittium angustum]